MRIQPRILLLATLGTLPLLGCFDEGPDHVIVDIDHRPPATPSGVTSVTGDGEVLLVWNPNTDADLAGYRIYWSPAEEGPYELMASTPVNRYLDRDVRNGVTYFYAVAAVDRAGNESELSLETVHDTPRPEGFDLVLWNSLGDVWQLSGYDFSGFARRPYDSSSADIYFEFDGERYTMVAADGLTDLQDAGYGALDDLDWAPPEGWTHEDRVTLIEGHCYYVWTSDDHFGKFRVTALAPDHVTLDWAYQTSKGNPELVVARGG